ncbi:lasso peptide biosynthesis B2 protein [Bacillus sp. AFS017336]|uniref:lasso peptide biosynthesis B2 protein n=1 Tax=Bacillus sp. AFS017336 TaxID=2033489 RepID=UPI000BF0F981|nr:lasso peptide biosynthesis B2 protein [Bacillus sp. AFS017336]PEL07013.1 stage V sporulation protein S [Bacillus sp. AFS017336]
MTFINRLRIFFSMDIKIKLLCVEAFVYLGWGRFLKGKQFAKVAPTLGKRMTETSLSFNAEQIQILRDISSSLNIMSRYTVWESKCLVKAIAGMKMLERRRINSTLYLGTGKDENGKLIAHAWLRSGPIFVTGSEGMEKFTVVGKFAKVVSEENKNGENNE